MRSVQHRSGPPAFRSGSLALLSHPSPALPSHFRRDLARGEGDENICPFWHSLSQINDALALGKTFEGVLLSAEAGRALCGDFGGELGYDNANSTR